MISIIILISSLFLDGLLTNYLPYLVNDLSLFTPLFTVVSIFLIYPFYRKKDNKYYLTVFITGIIYDLLYTNLGVLNGVLFLLIGITSKYIHKYFEPSIIKLAINIIIIISIYESLMGLILFIFQLVPVTIPKISYKITHSLLMNIIYAELIELLIKSIPNKYRKISIN